MSIPPGSQDPPPFFLVGFQRSGTTLLRVMLDAHPEIAVPLDTVGLWSRYEAKLPTYGDLASPEVRRKLTEDLLGEERIRLWETPLASGEIMRRWVAPGYPGAIRAFHEAYAAAKGKRRWGDKDPGNMLRIPQLVRWFPDARFIHIIRDGRDACLSQLNQDFGFDDCLPCAEAWREQVWWVRNLGAVLGKQRYLEIRYEDLLAEPENRLRDVCEFLQIPFAPQMLEYHRSVQGSIPDSKRHIWPLIDRPPQRDNVELWREKMSSGVRVCFEKRAGGLLRELGYPTLPGPASGGYVEEARSLMRRAWSAIMRRIRSR